MEFYLKFNKLKCRMSENRLKKQLTFTKTEKKIRVAPGSKSRPRKTK